MIDKPKKPQPAVTLVEPEKTLRAGRDTIDTIVLRPGEPPVFLRGEPLMELVLHGDVGMDEMSEAMTAWAKDFRGHRLGKIEYEVLETGRAVFAGTCTVCSRGLVVLWRKPTPDSGYLMGGEAVTHCSAPLP